MDLLSITAGIIAILGALSSGTKAALQVWNASDELRELHLELNRLITNAEIIFRIIQSQTSGLTDGQIIQSLRSNYDRLRDAQNSFQDKVGCKQTTQDAFISYRGAFWLTKRKEIRRLLRDVVEIRRNLCIAVQLLTLSSVISLNKQDAVLADNLRLEQNEIVQCYQNKALVKADVDVSHIQSSRIAIEEYFEITSWEISETHGKEDDDLDGGSQITRYHTPYSDLSSWSFESSASFLPEIYIVEQARVQGLSIVYSITESYRTRTYRIDRYCLLVAMDSRHWKRVLVTARVPLALGISEMAYTDVHSLYIILPGSVQSQLENLMQTCEMYDSVTNIHIELLRDAQNNVTFEVDRSRVVEGTKEALVPDTFDYIESLRYQGLTSYVESQVAVLARESSLLLVIVDSQLCVERKLPFVDELESSKRPFERFTEDMKNLLHAQGCKGIAKFVGVVLSDDRTQLLSYLIEAPRQGPLLRLLGRASRSGVCISWYRREKWIRQILTTASEAHRRGVVMGIRPYTNNDIWVDSNDDLRIINCTSSASSFQNGSGYMPPELRKSTPSGCFFTGHDRSMTFQTDIFQIGLLVWRIAQQLSNPSVVSHYHVQDCNHRLRAQCTADHTNPIQLPPCVGDDIPEYINTIVTHCRQELPSRRPPAFALLALLPTPEVSEHPSNLPQMEDIYHRRGRAPIEFTCDNCGGNATLIHYHCAICVGGNFDLCVGCVQKNITCLDDNHCLVRRVLRNDRFVDEPIDTDC